MMRREPYVNSGSSGYGNSEGAPAGTSSGGGPEEEDEEEEEEEERNMVGFMFGNTEDLLDVDYLDEDAKGHLNAVAHELGGFGGFELLSSSVSNLKDDEDYGRKVDNAIDYEDIDEAVEDDGELSQDNTEYYARAALFTQSKPVEEENYDEDEEEIVSVVPSPVSGPSERAPAEVPIQAVTTSSSLLGKHGDGPQAVTTSSSPLVKHGDSLQAVTISSPLVKHGGGLVSADTADISFEDLDEDWDDFDSDDNEPYEDLSPDEEGGDIFLPVIYEENGKQILQFSEIFGAKQSDWIIGNKKLRSKRSVFKGKVETRLRDDEADVLKNFPEKMDSEFLRGSELDMKEDHNLFEEIDDSEKCRQHVGCEPLNRSLSPLVDIEGTQSANFNPIHQLDWESGIVWGEERNNMHSDDREGRDSTETQYQTLEPLSRQTKPSRSVTKHPQMLRLEICHQHAGTDIVKRSEALSLTLESRNMEFAAGKWLDDVRWDEPKPVQHKVTWDFTDSRMVFEVLDTRETRIIRQHAAAMVISPRTTKGRPPEAAELTLPSRFNISNDLYYGAKKGVQPQKLLQKKRVSTGAVKVVHSVPALRLQTMKPKLNNKDLAYFHRPKATWFPYHNEVAAKDQGALAARGPMKVILKSLGGNSSKLHIDTSDTLESFKLKAVKKLGDLKLSEPTKIMYAGRLLEAGKTFADQKIPPNSLLHLIRTKVHLWKPQRLPSDKPTRPPGAFKKKSELSVKDGHVTLMEYCEERPLLLSNVGMGAVLSTYYRKTSVGDTTATTLKDTWSGTIIPLEPAEESPFIGNLRLGDSQSCLETNMYRAPVFKHRVSSRDFLLVRSAKGKLSLRRIDNFHVVGQQEPHMEVTAPSSKTVLHYVGNRLLVYVYREFRSKEKPGVVPQIGAEELAAQFPTVSEAMVRKKLKNVADLQRGPNGDMRWVMRRGFRIPSEEELRRLVTPENVCTYESMQAGIHHLKRMGVHKLTQLNGLSAAMTQLPDEALTLAAATHIERELQLTPWNLSSNFVSATLQGRNCIEKLEISGPGDPSGRGLGFSFLRVALRPGNAGAAVEKKAAAARGGGSVTGTDADLRRLSMEAAREVLLQFKVSEEEIDKLTRWHRIALVRKLSSEQVAVGADLKMAKHELNKYARGQRMSALQLQQQSKVKAQDIWDRQVRNLAGSDDHSDIEAEDNAAGDLDDFAGDLENLLEAEEDDGKNMAAKKEAKDNARGVGRNKYRQAQLEEDLEDEAAEAAELQRMLMEDDEAEEKKAANDGNEAPIAVTPSAPVSTPATGPFPGFGPSSVRKRKKTVLKRTSHTKGPDGQMIKKVEVITDPIQVANYLAKKKEREGQKTTIGKVSLEKKVTIKTLKDKKAAPAMKSLVSSNAQKSSKARDKICGGCGQVGHMRTNKKKCPLYAGGGATAPPRPEPEEIVDRSLPRITIKKVVEPAPKVRVKFKSEAVTVKSSEPKPVTTNGHEASVAPPSVTPFKIRIVPPKLKAEVEAEAEKQKLEEESQLAKEERDAMEQEVAKESESLEGLEMQTMADNPEKQETAEAEGERVSKKRHRSEEKQKKKKKKRKKEHKERQKDTSDRILDVSQAQEEKVEEQEQKRNSLVVVQQPLPQPAPRIIIKPVKRREPPLEAPEPPPNPKRQKKRGGEEVEIANIFEDIVNRMRQHECSKLFRKAVTKREAPDYRDVISHPMDLSIIRDRARKFFYKNREDFLTDVQLIVDNAHLYNEFRHPLIPPEADKLFQVCEQLLEENEELLEELESRIKEDDNGQPQQQQQQQQQQKPQQQRPHGGGGGGGGRKRSLRSL